MAFVSPGENFVDGDGLDVATVAQGADASDRFLRPSTFVVFEWREAGDGLVAVLYNDFLAGFDLGDEFGEASFRVADFDGDGHGRLADFRPKSG